MTDSKPRPAADADASATVRQIPSQELFRGQRTVMITHAGEQYRLMITRNDKLILQK